MPSYVDLDLELTVSEGGPLRQFDPVVVRLQGDQFAIGWRRENADGQDDALVRLVDATAGSLTGTIEVALGTVYPYASGPSLSMAALSDGSFVVALAPDSYLSTATTYREDVSVHLFDGTGDRVAGPLTANPPEAEAPTAVVVSAVGTDRFIVIWDGDATGGDITGRLFDGSGTPIGDPFVVAAGSSPIPGGVVIFDVHTPCVSPLENGGFVLTWTDKRESDGESADVRAQLFDAAGAPVGTHFLVNSVTSSHQEHPRVAGLADGGFVAVWTDSSSGAAVLKAQQFASDGSRIGGELLVTDSPGLNLVIDSRYTTDAFDVVGLADGGFAITWLSPNNERVLLQCFASGGARVGAEEIVSDGASGQSRLSPNIELLSSGELVVTWMEGQSGAYTWNVMAEVLAPSLVLSGTSGSDVLEGGSGHDTLSGLAGDDSLFGNGGNDALHGGAGADAMSGGGGNDTYYVDNTADQAYEASASGGTDQVFSSVSFGLWAHVENLTLTGTAAINGTGNSLDNRIAGNDAANVLNGGAGADVMIGGLGSDTYYVDNISDQAYEASASGGTDRVFSSVSFGLWPNIENLTLTGTAAINGTGNGLANAITGNSAANVLNGGAGADTLSGGLGNDTYYIDNTGDLAIESSSSGGTDRVFSSVSFGLWPNIENLTLTGSAAINGTGNSLDNSITGNGAANVINGGAGTDLMSGGLGDDTYYIDNSGDQAFEGSSTGGTDRVFSSVSFGLWPNIETLTLTGTAAINGTGNALDNSIIGNGAANTLNGGAGADAMSGGLGNDSYYVDNIGDRAYESSASGGSDRVFSSVSFVLGPNLETLVLTGTAATNGTGNGLANSISGNGAANILAGGDGSDALSGNDGNDTLRGDAGDDQLYAGSGADSLSGGTGNDTLSGGAGADLFAFNTALDATTNVDRIIDFSAADDTMLLDQTIFSALTATCTLNASAFHTGTAAQDADDRIIYDSSTGRIYYDADGNGAGAQVLFAQVNAGTSLTNADFLIVG